MQFFKRRPLKEEVKNALKDARHARNMREDLCEPDQLRKLDDAVQRVEALWKERAAGKVLQDALQGLHHQTCRVYPPHPQPKWHENTEVLVVALGAAMAIRAYFVQPFKIPTGSMQPTLNGILHEEHTPDITDKPLIANVKWLITGKMYKAATGMLKIAGDHVIVNKFWYNFVSPRRGDVVVFDTAGVSAPRNNSVTLEFQAKTQSLGQVEFVQHGDEWLDRATARSVKQVIEDFERRYLMPIGFKEVKQEQGVALTYYIKRMVGEPGDEISISEDGHLLANGAKITAPYAFERQVAEYGGYLYAPGSQITANGDSIKLADDEFLPFGDNSANSMDGRYFGGVKCDALLGPAFMVYWPFGGHWGAIK